MGYALLADLIVAVHVAYVSYVVVGQLAIVVGLLRRWEWVRNPWFRLTHLAAIAIVALEAIFDIECPLTVWERRLRGLAGQDVDQTTFIGRLLHDLIFWDAPPWVFPLLHVGFALLVLATFVLAPPRWRSRPAVRFVEGRGG
jgi:hypothetical protein